MLQSLFIEVRGSEQRCGKKTWDYGKLRVISDLDVKKYRNKSIPKAGYIIC